VLRLAEPAFALRLEVNLGSRILARDPKPSGQRAMAGRARLRATVEGEPAERHPGSEGFRALRAARSGGPSPPPRYRWRWTWGVASWRGISSPPGSALWRAEPAFALRLEVNLGSGILARDPKPSGQRAPAGRARLRATVGGEPGEWHPGEGSQALRAARYGGQSPPPRYRWRWTCGAASGVGGIPSPPGSALWRAEAAFALPLEVALRLAGCSARSLRW